MAFRSDVPDQIRGFFYANSGDDALSGTTIELAKSTMQAAIDEASALIPTPDFSNTASVSPSQPGNYTESITLTEGLFFNAVDVSLIADDTFTVMSADSTGSSHGVVGNTQNGSSVFDVTGSVLFGIRAIVAVNSGDSSSVYDIGGTVDDVIIDVDLTQCAGDGTVGLNFTGQSDTFVVLSGARIDLIGDNSTAIIWDPSAASEIGVCNVGSISTTAISQVTGDNQSGANTTAFDIRGGVYSANLASIESAELCDIDSGATLNLMCPETNGSITVNSGGTLNCVIPKHTGAVTNNGTINGIINGVRYGNWQAAVDWGDIGGTLSNQTDLQTELDGKKDDFTENTAFNKDFGTTSGTVLEGDTVFPSGVVTDSFDANDAIYPASDPAVASSRNGHPVIAFDDSTAENVIFNDVMSDAYDDGDIDVNVDWVAETATTGGVTWGVEFERNNAGGTDIDSDSFDTQQTANSTTNGTSGIITRTTITLTQAESDDLEAGEAYRMRVQRVTGDGGDTMSDDAQIISVSVVING